MDRGLRFALLALCTMLCSCGIHPPVRRVEVARTRTAIALVARPEPTTVDSAQFSRTRGALTAGAAGGTIGAGAGLGTGPLAPLAVPVLAGTGLLIGSVAGAVDAGGSGTLPAALAPAVGRALQDAAQNGQLSAAMLEAVAQEARVVVPYRVDVLDPGSVAGQRALAVHQGEDYEGLLELRVERLGLVGLRGIGSDRALFLVADVKYYDATSGRLTIGRGLVYQSEGRPATHWADNDARRVSIEIERAYRVLAQRAVESVLLGANEGPISLVGEHRRDGSGCGLIPTSPAPRFERFLLGKPHAAPVQAESTTPLLAWRAPGPPQQSGIGPQTRYDLRIWATDDGPAAPVYERFGLTAGEHRVEQPLSPGTTYYWSVRPRFDAGGQPRAVRWSAADGHPFAPHRDAAAASYSSAIVNGQYQESHCPVPSPGEWLLDYAGDDRKAWRTCTCLDFAPTDSQYRFVTPAVLPPRASD
jgi:hypothetical protein